MASDPHRLRKYARKKRMAFASRNPELNRYLTLYWRYWHRLYSPHLCLWKDVHG